MDKTSLGDRMKKYERAFKFSLPQRMPVIIRIDGKAFHAYTRGIPSFSQDLREVMDITVLELCEQIQGAQFAYVQSDEISILIHTYKRFTSQGWFDNGLQKITSVSAAIAAATFTANSGRFADSSSGLKPAYFDSRAFVLPESDVNNYFIWRQQDWHRNSVQMLARTLYSHKECYKKNNSELQEMCFQKGKNWNDLPLHDKRGRCIVKTSWLPPWAIEHGYRPLIRDRNWCSTPAWDFKKEKQRVGEFLQVEEE